MSFASALRTPTLPAPDLRLALLGAVASTAALLVLLAPSIASAQDVKAAYEVNGKIGIGYTTGNAPVGIRMWFSEQFGFDVGLGLVINGNEPDVEDPGDTTTTADFALDAGFLIAIWKSDQTILFIRPGINFDRRYNPNGFDNIGQQVHSSTETIAVNALVGFELFLTELGFENLSLQGGIGLGLNYVVPPADDRPGVDNDGDWSFGSLVTDVSVVETAQLGFHYYFY